MLFESNTEKIAKELAGALAQSEEYLAYKETMARLKERPDLYTMVNEFRRRHFAIQNGSMDRISYDEYNSFAAESRRLREEPLINEFLDAEVSLGRLVQRLKKIIISGIDFECDFLE